MDKEAIFNKVRTLVEKYNRNMDVRSDSPTNYSLYGKRTVEAFNKQVDGMYFASAVINKNFIGFYFFPIYTHPEEFAKIPTELKKCLKGKSCFHIKAEDELLMSQIDTILHQGYQLYEKHELI